MPLRYRCAQGHALSIFYINNIKIIPCVRLAAAHKSTVIIQGIHPGPGHRIVPGIVPGQVLTAHIFHLPLSVGHIGRVDVCGEDIQARWVGGQDI